MLLNTLTKRIFFIPSPHFLNNPVNCAALKRKTHRAAISNHFFVGCSPAPAFRLKPSPIVRNIKKATCAVQSKQVARDNNYH